MRIRLKSLLISINVYSLLLFLKDTTYLPTICYDAMKNILDPNLVALRKEIRIQLIHGLDLKLFFLLT